MQQYLYDDDNYQKPLFTLYFKTSLFSLYLLAIPFVPSWRALAAGRVWRPVEDDDSDAEGENDGNSPLGSSSDTDRLLDHAAPVDDDVSAYPCEIVVALHHNILFVSSFVVLYHLVFVWP